MGIRFQQKGNFSKTYKFLNNAQKHTYIKAMEKYGKRGVEELKKVTPKRTGLTADSWDYKIEEKNGYIRISWVNTNIQNGINIAILIRYGHGTRNGGYVTGVDYISPSLGPIFQEMADAAWEEVTQK